MKPHQLVRFTICTSHKTINRNKNRFGSKRKRNRVGLAGHRVRPGTPSVFACRKRSPSPQVIPPLSPAGTCAYQLVWGKGAGAAGGFGRMRRSTWQCHWKVGARRDNCKLRVRVAQRERISDKGRGGCEQGQWDTCALCSCPQRIQS